MEIKMKRKIAIIGLFILMGVMVGCGKNVDSERKTNLSESSQTETISSQQPEITIVITEENSSETEVTEDINTAENTKEAIIEGTSTADNMSETTDNPNYYQICTALSKEEVEAFASKVKQQILSHNWADIAEEIAYPITVGDITYENKEEFASGDFDDILDDAFMKAIEAESCKNMFCNWQGIMLGTGQLWISEVLNDDLSSQGLKITAINVIGE